MQIASTPANPAKIARDFDTLSLVLSDEGLTISHLYRGTEVTYSIDEALVLSDFLRGPGARALISRLWLAQQHGKTVSE
jgi:hypothetical protein